VYVRRKVRRISLAKVAPGTLVDVSYTIEELKPYRTGDFHTGWRVNPGLPVRRSRLVLDVPAGFEPRIKERNLGFSRKVENGGGRRRIVWATQDVPKWEAEPFAADSNGVVETIDIAAPSSWKDIGAWYAGLARDRYQVTPAVARKVAELVQGAHSLEDSLRALHRFVAHDVRYVAVSLGIGGYQPRPAAQVLETGFGDCKDKATLFVHAGPRWGNRLSGAAPLPGPGGPGAADHFRLRPRYRRGGARPHRQASFRRPHCEL